MKQKRQAGKALRGARMLNSKSRLSDSERPPECFLRIREIAFHAKQLALMIENGGTRRMFRTPGSLADFQGALLERLSQLVLAYCVVQESEILKARPNRLMVGTDH